MSRSNARLVPVLLFFAAALGCAPDGDPLETKQSALVAPLFKPAVSYPVGSWATSVATGDLNGDGRTDVAVTTSSSSPITIWDNSLHVFLQAADGTLRPRFRQYLGTSPTSIAIGDVNGDGRADVVVANQGSATIGVLLQSASGTLASMTTYPTANASQVEIGDFNSDGRMDVVSLGWRSSSGSIDVFLQTTAGTLAPPVVYDLTHGGSDDLEAGDVDGDGRTDIVVMNGAAAFPNIGVLSQKPGGTMGTPVYYSVGGDVLSKGVGIGDTNGDGRADVVVSYRGPESTSFIGRFLQSPEHTLAAAESLASDGNAIPIVLADVDGDGRKDVLTAHSIRNRIGVYRQTPTGGLGAEELSPLTTSRSTFGPQGMAVGDINSDGLLDVVIADTYDGLVVLRHVDDRPPTLALTAPPSGPICTGVGVELTWTASDNVGLDHFDVSASYDGGTTYVAVSGCTGLPATARACAFVPGPGAPRLRVTASDAANNKAHVEASVIVNTPAVQLDQSSYAPGATISVSFTCLPGNAPDWLGVAAAGASNTSFLAYAYTGGSRNGTATLKAPASAGAYVVRAFPNNTFDVLTETPFSVVATAPAVSTNATSYVPGASITVTYSNLPGGTTDWIGVAVADAPSTSFLSYVYTGGNKGGTATLPAPSAAGSYVVRAFPNNTFVLLAESSFSVAAAPPVVSTNAATYAPGASITVTYSNLPGGATDWIGVAAVNAPSTSFLSYVYTGGGKSGTATIAAPSSGGSYVIRAFPNNTFDVLAETAFSVSVTPTVTTNAATYAPGTSIAVTYSNLPGHSTDWIGVAAAGSPSTSYISYVYTRGAQSGVAAIAAPASAGSYVIRAFPNNTYDLIAETPFTVSAGP